MIKYRIDVPFGALENCGLGSALMACKANSVDIVPDFRSKVMRFTICSEDMKEAYLLINNLILLVASYGIKGTTQQD